MSILYVDNSYLLGVPGRFLFFFWGAVDDGAVDEVGVEDCCCCCCLFWLWSSSLVPKNGVDDEAAAIFDESFYPLLVVLFVFSLNSPKSSKISSTQHEISSSSTAPTPIHKPKEQNKTKKKEKTKLFTTWMGVDLPLLCLPPSAKRTKEEKSKLLLLSKHE